MKKTLLSLSLALCAGMAYSQVTTYVLQPPELEGPLDFTWPQWGQQPDLNDPANQVVAFAAFGNDGNSDPTLAVLGCNPFVNAAEVAGKIAVVRRGTCQFGQKALNAQNAGAVAVVIINNQPGPPVAMGAGDFGGDVTIPSVMITLDDGNALAPDIAAGNVELLIGSVFGVYEFNLFTSNKLANIGRYSAMPGPMADQDNFSVNLGAWVKNFGSATQSGVSLNGRVTRNGVEVYNNNSTTATLALGDSVFFSLPAFSDSPYNGLYEFTYTINSPNEDEFPSDNSFGFNFLADSLIAFAPINPTTRRPTPSGHFRASGNQPAFMACTYFRSPIAGNVNASLSGIYTSAAKAGGASIDGEVLEARLYEWNDNFSGWSSATFNNVVQMYSEDYFYTSDLGSQVVWIPFFTPYPLENNKKYLFCSFSPATDVFLGFDETLDYTNIIAQNDRPIYVANNNGSWVHFGDDLNCAVGGVVALPVGIEERDRVELTPFPNPTADFIRIPLTGLTGAALVEVVDLAGNTVLQRRVSVGGDQVLVMDLAGIANGMYTFRMNFEDGRYSTFRVVVGR